MYYCDQIDDCNNNDFVDLNDYALPSLEDMIKALGLRVNLKELMAGPATKIVNEYYSRFPLILNK